MWLILAGLASAVASQEPRRLVVSADVSRLYERLSAAPPRTALALAYLLHEPEVQLLAVAAGFGGSSTYQRWFSPNPCQAAERFLSEMGSSVPVVCGSKVGFLDHNRADDSLTQLMQGGASWLVLDSWAAAAAVTMPSMKCRALISEFLLPGPGVLFHGNAVSGPFSHVSDASMGSPGVLLRAWQDSFQEARPRLRVLGLASGWRQAALHRHSLACRGSWIHRRLDQGAVVGIFYDHAIRLARSVRFGPMSTALQGIVHLAFPQETREGQPG
ncbi:unnamed protein product [Effrenium voratum]|nr:unnamed protein product [Effrenium voratum]